MSSDLIIFFIFCLIDCEEKSSPSLLTIEDNHFDLDSDSKKEKINYMKNQGYVLINNIGVTMFFFKKTN